MKVILLQELKGRGAEGDVVDVARGFAVNYLFPRKVAIEATPGNLKQLDSRMHNIRKRDEARVADATDLAAALDGKSVGIEAKVGEEGRLYGSVTAQMIGDAVLDQLGVEIDRRKIETHGHIKELGAHAIDVAIYRDVKAHLTVHVVAEGGAPVAFAPEGAATEVVEVTAEEATAEEFAAEEPAAEAAVESDADALDAEAFEDVVAEDVAEEVAEVEDESEDA